LIAELFFTSSLTDMVVSRKKTAKRANLGAARLEHGLKPRSPSKKKTQTITVSIFDDGLSKDYRDFEPRKRSYAVRRNASLRSQKILSIVLGGPPKEAGAPRKTWTELSHSRKQAILRDMKRGFEGKMRNLSKNFVGEFSQVGVKRLRVQYDMELESGELVAGGFELRREQKDYEYEKIRGPVGRSTESPAEKKKRKKEEKKAKKERLGYQVLAELAKSSTSQRVLQDLLWAQEGDLRKCFLDKLQEGIDEEMHRKLPTRMFARGVDGRWIHPRVLVELVLPILLGKVHCPSWLVIVLSGDGRKSGSTHGVVITLKICVGNARGTWETAVYPIAISRGTEKYANLKLMLDMLRGPLKVVFF
jgi:hypothetical protein